MLDSREREDTPYDTDNIHSQVAYLAKAFVQSGEPTWRRAAERGIDFILASQYANGGFPQRFPKPRGYAAHITYNDGVLIGILNMLLDATSNKPHFAWLDSERRSKAAAAVEKGIDCIRRTQIIVDGTPTGWCQQHDRESFEARPARTFELASICPQETSSIVQFLQRQPNHTPDVIKAMESATNWLRQVQLSGIRLERVVAPREEFLRKTVDYDIVVIEDHEAPPIWARHYEIGTNRPIFAGRDGVKKYTFAEIERERRTGTAWYGRWPEAILRPSKN